MEKELPEPVKIVELATALDTTVDYLLGKKMLIILSRQTSCLMN